MRSWHTETNPRHTVLRGSAGRAVATTRGFSEDQLSKLASGRRR